MSGYRFFHIDEEGTEYAINDQQNVYLRYGKQGFDAIRASAEMRRVPYTDGAERLGRIYHAPRRLGLPLMVKGDSQSELVAFMRTFRRRFSPYKGSSGTSYLKILTPDDVDLRIAAWVTQLSDLEMDGPCFGKFTLEYQAEAATFRAASTETETLALPSSAGFSIPLTIPASLASAAVDGYVSISNDGDVESWPVIRITGACDNPSITNDTTGLVMAVTQTQDADDYIEIDMENATIQHWDNSGSSLSNIIDNMSAASEFWPLERGVNTLHIEADSAVNGSIVVTYYERFLSA